MRLVIGYLATPSGEDGLALGVRLARTLGAQLDICLVLPPDRTLPARVPADTGYGDVLADHGRQWLEQALSTVPKDVEAHTHLSYHESHARGLLDEVDRLDAQAIVLGAASDGLLGRHAIGSVSSELLHSAHVPVALAPRGARHSKAQRIGALTCALGTRAGADVLLRTALEAGERMGTPLRLVSLVSLDEHHARRHNETPESVRERALTHAQDALRTATAVLPEDTPISSQIADGTTVESAVAKLEWHEDDLIMVGSSRLAQPRQLFLGSTAAKMLRVIPVPMVVVPKKESTNDD